MAVRARNPRGEGDRLRLRLLDAATELLADLHDPEALSVRAVTARAGVSPTALYLHFADKDELVNETKIRCFAALDARIAGAADAGGTDPVLRLCAMGSGYLAFAREQPGWYAVCFDTNFSDAHEPFPLVPIDPAAEACADGPSRPGMEVFSRLVAAVVACGGRDEQAAFEVATILWAALHGRAAVERALPGFPFPGEDPWMQRLADLVRAPETTRSNR